MSSEKVLEGESLVTVRHGDYTYFINAENFTIEVHDLADVPYYDMYHYRISKPPVVSYSIRSSVKADDEGIYLKVVHDRKRVLRTASIEVESLDDEQTKWARNAVKAPREATIKEYANNVVTFEWEDFV